MDDVSVQVLLWTRQMYTGRHILRRKFLHEFHELSWAPRIPQTPLGSANSPNFSTPNIPAATFSVTSATGIDSVPRLAAHGLTLPFWTKPIVSKIVAWAGVFGLYVSPYKKVYLLVCHIRIA